MTYTTGYIKKAKCYGLTAAGAVVTIALVYLTLKYIVYQKHDSDQMHYIKNNNTKLNTTRITKVTNIVTGKRKNERRFSAIQSAGKLQYGVVSMVCKKSEKDFVGFVGKLKGRKKDYLNFFWNVKKMTCIYHDLIDGKIDDRMPCQTIGMTNITLRTNLLASLKDYNKMDATQLGDYASLLAQFLPSLDAIMRDSSQISKNSYGMEIKNVRDSISTIRTEMMTIRKELYQCQGRSVEKLRNLPMIIEPYAESPITKKYTKSERAMSIFQQIQIVFHAIKTDFSRRRKCLD